MKAKKNNETPLINFAEKLTDSYLNTSDFSIRKLKGQFFTPKQVALFMSGLFNIKKKKIRLLDPGAGTGILCCAFCERLIKFKSSRTLEIDAYESDTNLVNLLEETLAFCKNEVEKRGHKFEYKIHKEDFVLHNARYFNQNLLFDRDLKFYDFVISNPPYFKLSKDSKQSRIMEDMVSGQPNIYTFFMALSLAMLKDNGELVFITPRSFCSGLYYKRFREWFFDKSQISNIHIFESRKDVFDKDNVLQENIILKAKRAIEKTRTGLKIRISKSKDKSFTNLEWIDLPYNDIVHSKNGDVIIRIPASERDNRVLHLIDSMPNTLHSLGLEISTGPVVHFRAKEHLLPEFNEKGKEAPLLWMHNIKDMDVVWPHQKNNKEMAIKISNETRPLLVPVKNYVLVKRFSSKEQKRRLYAGILLASEIKHEFIGLENHLNYIHRPFGELSEDEAYGIAAFLNSSVTDNFFRAMNGNTQVNATDIRKLPLPSKEEICMIGNEVRSEKLEVGPELDSMVSSILNIKSETL